LQQTIDALSNPTDYQYDSHDQLKEVTAPNPNGIVSQYIYDDFEQLIQETSQDLGITPVSIRCRRQHPGENGTQYHYNARNRLESLSQQGQITTRYHKGSAIKGPANWICYSCNLV